jgi:parvulin-like peptidyl-prolyl isomerase
MSTQVKMSLNLKVGEQIVTKEDLFPLLAQYQMLPQLAREILVDRTISSIDCTEEEINIARQQFYQQNHIDTEEKVEAFLKQKGLSREQLEATIARSVKLDKFKQDNWGDRVDSHFIQRKPQLDQVLYSLIRNQNTGIIQELYFRLQEKEASFSDLAKEYSQGAETQTGGLIGPVELSSPHPKIAQILSVSQPGQIWPPIRVGEWFVIVRLEKFITAQLDAAMRQRMLDEMFQSWLREQMQKNVSYIDAE